METNLAFSTFGASHDKARVWQVPLAILGAVDIGATTLDLYAACLDCGVNRNSIGAFGLFGSTMTLDLTAFCITGREKNTK